MQGIEDTLIKHGWDGIVPYDENITINYSSLLNAIQEYANKIHFSRDELKKIANKYADRILDGGNTNIKLSEQYAHSLVLRAFEAGYKFNN